MSRLITNVVDDLHAGRQSWRVMLLLTIPALAAGFIAGLVSVG